MVSTTAACTAALVERLYCDADLERLERGRHDAVGVSSAGSPVGLCWNWGGPPRVSCGATLTRSGIDCSSFWTA